MPDPVLRLHAVSFARNGRSILSKLSWQVQAGEIAAVLGPNGCGKSTLLRVAAGYLWPQAGKVQLFGQTFGEAPIPALRARIGIVEASAVYPFDEQMTARDVVLSGYFSALTIGYQKITRVQSAHAAHLLDQVGLSGRAAQLYATMSTGERLRCLLARALVRKPELLLLDEPTAGLDLPAREAALATLARLHRAERPPAMITVTHHLEELLPGTGNILLLSATGNIVAAGPPKLVLTSDNLSQAYGLSIHVTHRQGRYAAHVDPSTWDELLR